MQGSINNSVYSSGRFMHSTYVGGLGQVPGKKYIPLAAEPVL